MLQLFMSKREMLQEEQELILSVDQKDIKEEQEKIWPSPEGQQLHWLEDADITELPFTAVPVKIENEDHTQTLLAHQTEMEENTESEPLASSSTAHRTLTVDDDEEDYRGPQSASIWGPYRYLQPDTNGGISDSSEAETDDSYEWEPGTEHWSGLNCEEKIESMTNTARKQFHCSKCGEAFRHVNYAEQQNRIQESEKFFSCAECDKRWRQKGSLTTQAGSHTGEKMFVCSECGKHLG
ncbi:zinc finger protein 135-like [Thalassophryne amazonica]|uniref:zinc finger protein 135-like n=1 Tax=Thalassophryne amazonica TaxID=390379 RepID=UPI0014709A65|nr:zinc finger protein 135-like [Thalassophryne amazonica]